MTFETGFSSESVYPWNAQRGAYRDGTCDLDVLSCARWIRTRLIEPSDTVDRTVAFTSEWPAFHGAVMHVRRDSCSFLGVVPHRFPVQSASPTAPSAHRGVLVSLPRLAVTGAGTRLTRETDLTVLPPFS